jgi:peptidyl-prolyl cis-trans isomerase D
MMGFMRSFVKSPWAIGLFGLLVVGLIMTMGDPLQMGPIGGFIKADARSLGPRDINRVLDQEINSMRVERNEIITQRDAAERGITQAIIQEMTQQSVALAYADKIGVRASPKAVASIINQAPMFKDGLGAVDQNAVARYASEQGFRSTAEFETLLRDSITYDYLRQATLGGLKTPQILSRPIVTFLGEKRTIDLGQLTPESVPAPAAPDEAALRAFYTERQAMFAQPERRSVSALVYTADDFIDKVDVTPEQVKAEYDRRIRDFSGPETREILQFTSANQDRIQAVVDLVKQGRTLEEAVAANPGVELATLSVKPGDIADKAYSDNVFAIPQGETFGPMPLNGAFVGVQVKQVTAGAATPLEQVSEMLRTELARRDAERMFDDTSEMFYDLVGGGSSLEEIGKEVGAPVIEYAPVDARAGTENGPPAALLAAAPQALQTLFQLKSGETSDIVELELPALDPADPQKTTHARMVLRLDGVVAARTPPFEEVREELTPIYTAVKQIEAADKLANEIVATIKGGKPFAEAARAAKLVQIPNQTLTRGAAGQTDQALVEGIFNIEAGGVGVVKDGQGVPWIVKINTVETVGDNADPQLVAQVDQILEQSLTRDIAEAFSRGVQKEVKVRVNDKAIADYLASFKQDAEQ